jgi:putative oxidoreductase
LTVGGTFFVHGTQKLFGWFGGYGPDGTGQFFESLGLRAGKRNAIAAGSTETGCGVLVALGLATPLAAAGLSAVMITALRTAVWNEGFKPATGEHEMLLAAAALRLTDTGPGAASLDSALGNAGAAGSAMAISRGRRQERRRPPPRRLGRPRHPRRRRRPRRARASAVPRHALDGCRMTHPRRGRPPDIASEMTGVASSAACFRSGKAGTAAASLVTRCSSGSTRAPKGNSHQR